MQELFNFVNPREGCTYPIKHCLVLTRKEMLIWTTMWLNSEDASLKTTDATWDSPINRKSLSRQTRRQGAEFQAHMVWRSEGGWWAVMC